MDVPTLEAFYGNIIAGKEVPASSGRTFQSIDPTTGSGGPLVAFGDEADVDQAVDAAWKNQETAWSRQPRERAVLLRRVAQLIRDRAPMIAAVESMDAGKPRANAIQEANLGAEFFDYYAGLIETPDGRTYPVDPGYFVYSKRVPYGVVGAIAPWNYPFLLACWKSAPALAAGNSVVMKMAEQSPLSTTLLGRLMIDAGLPDGAFNVVHGDGPTTGAALARHPRVPKVTFTGSTAVGRSILQAGAASIKSVHLELGGKTPNIVFADADVPAAVSGSLFTSFYNTGQICTSGSRLLVERSIADDFISALADRASAIPVGHPMDARTRLGPLISDEQLARVRGYVTLGQREGARLLIGGDRPADAPVGGYFLAPTIFVDVTPGMRIAQEEIFGPVLSVIPFDAEDEAVRIANGVTYGLAATVWTTNLRRTFRLADRLDAGIIWTNCPHFLPVNVPYEGHKLSGLGEDLGVEALHTFTHLKTHCVAFDAAPPPWA